MERSKKRKSKRGGKKKDRSAALKKDVEMVGLHGCCSSTLLHSIDPA